MMGVQIGPTSTTLESLPMTHHLEVKLGLKSVDHVPGFVSDHWCSNFAYVQPQVWVNINESKVCVLGIWTRSQPRVWLESQETSEDEKSRFQEVGISLTTNVVPELFATV